ncbi:DUF421 domain-containing protein [Spirosoma sp. KUDC1026]|uniref:DUF421 domain-containing protein n=1 Tax=Spirosoma sp. KUDC1026 TaxID=2745947 RepID=UPI00159BEFB6|nr:YetF domain-containing protein [Spirosoma sp. KUDC1026]QKZ12435.1 DUF421 domain-containing protein [Spirosoma sp. KUDC1026]
MPAPSVDPFDWERILIDQFPWLYLGEVALRTLCMFIILLTALTVSGKREVRQLSIYELVLVIGLGSAAGDPMFYDDVPISSAVVVFIVMMVCYKLATRISDHNESIRKKIEGKAVYVVEQGRILIRNFSNEDLSQEELFSDLRVAGIEQLGQVRIAILEANGQLSVFQFGADDAKPGLSILPRELSKKAINIDEAGNYACCTCGSVQPFTHPVPEPVCDNCLQKGWIKAVS